MANLKGFKFFDFNSTETISNILSNPNKGETVTIEICDDGSAKSIDLIVEGKSDIEMETDSQWHQVAAISLTDYSLNTEITKTGIYSVPFSGVSMYRLRSKVPVGNIKVYAIVTD